MKNEKPFSPETLAERWSCSARTVRNMIASGDLAAFRLGAKLWRIDAAEVERVEGLVANAPSPDLELRDRAKNAARNVRQIAARKR